MRNHGNYFMEAVRKTDRIPAALLGLALILADDKFTLF